MKRRRNILIYILIPVRILLCDFPEYNSNPFTFSVPEPIHGWGTHIFVVDINGDGLLDFTYRSESKLYVYDHYGSKLWDKSIPNPGVNHGTKHGAADIDGDGVVEIVAVNNSNQVIVFDGRNGNVEVTIDITVDQYQTAGHVAIANFRGQGDRDILVQTVDQSDTGPGYYINRTLIALRCDTYTELWRVEQDRNTGNGYYEGYWGPAHGSFLCADIDRDGKDEVIGVNMIDDNGIPVSLGYPASWVGQDPGGYIDHIDAMSIGDYLPDRPGLEWILTEEDWKGQTDWHATLMSSDGVIWRKEVNLFTYEWEREPQNVAVGNFDDDRAGIEVWLRSRFGSDRSQHPWLFDAAGTLFSDYETVNTLPSGFNTDPDYGNKEGLETIWTIDWTGAKQEHIAAKARHNHGNVGVFDAVTGEALWTTVGSDPLVKASSIYVADVAGDGREEVILFDETDSKIKVYWNEASNPNDSRPDKWNDPLYQRIKQNWNYYSPGSYTYGEYPVISDIAVTHIAYTTATISWHTDVASDSQIEYGITEQYGSTTPLDSILKMDHTVLMDALMPNTTYHFRIKSCNGYGKLGVTPDQTDLVTLPLETPQVSDITIYGPEKLRFTWISPPDFSEYNVYRSHQAYFQPDRDGGSNRIGYLVRDHDDQQAGIQWTDTLSATGDWETNFFYLVTAVNGVQESDSSNPVGEFDFRLVTTPYTDFNEIALSLIDSRIKNASDLVAAIPSCNSVARWNAAIQGYEQYVPGIPPTNFPVQGGYPYYVNVTCDTVFTLMGPVASPSFVLITTPATDFNEVMLTHDKTGITRASELMADIPTCNGVAKWDATIQGYQQYIPGIPPTDFDVRAGYPYYVNVTADVTWPDDAQAKRVTAEAGITAGEDGSGAPHAVWGDMIPTFREKIFHFSAYVESRSGERLTDDSPGCMLGDDYWLVQCASFPTRWKEGETLKVEFSDEKGVLRAETVISLTYEPADEGGDIFNLQSESSPVGYALAQNYPNPFNPETTIAYQLPREGRVRIFLYNMMGEEIRPLVDEIKKAGSYEVIWDGRDENGLPVASGVYILCMRVGGFSQVRRILLVQ